MQPAQPNDISDARQPLAPSGQLVAPWGPAQLGLDGQPYAPNAVLGQTDASSATWGEGAQPPLSAEGANPHLGPYTRFPAGGLGDGPRAPEGPSAGAWPKQLDLPLGRWDRHAAQLELFDARPDHPHPVLGAYAGEHTRLGKCEKVRRERGADVELARNETGQWRTSGLVLCKTWQCATCGARRARDAAATLSTAIAEHRKRGPGYDVWLLTLTLWHTREESQRAKFDRLFSAWDAFSKSGALEDFAAFYSLRGIVRCLDETFGPKGVHPHFHVLLFVGDAPAVRSMIGGELGAVPMRGATPKDRAAALHEIARGDFLDAWERAVRATGVFPDKPGVVQSFRDHAVDLRGGDDAAAYVVKWGLADEATRGPDKRDSHTELLNRYIAGSSIAGELYREWADATRGRHFVTGVSRLRASLELTDEQIEAHVAEMRRRRDAELERAGERPPPRTPLRVRIAPYLFPAAISLGWRRVIDAAEAAELAGDDVQQAVDRLLIIVRVSERDVRGPPIRAAPC